MKKALLEVLETFIDSIVGGVIICVGIGGYISCNDDKLIKCMSMIAVILGLTSIQVNAQRRANKKYIRKDRD
jgi:hypothetical protein